MQEIWKNIVNYEGKYQISNTGKVKSMNYNNTNISCAYCKYRDLCFVREDDVVYIEEGEK